MNNSEIVAAMTEATRKMHETLKLTEQQRQQVLELEIVMLDAAERFCQQFGITKRHLIFQSALATMLAKSQTYEMHKQMAAQERAAETDNEGQ